MIGTGGDSNTRRFATTSGVAVAGILLLLAPSAVALEPIPHKLVVLTFDDSAKSHFTVVRPLLKKYGFGATFFITEGFDFRDNKRDYMTWAEIKALHDDGFEIGNHTRDHFVVNANNIDKLREQVEAITVRCREHGIPDPVSFAYPGNGFDVKALPILRECGIRWARRGVSPEFDYAEGHGPRYRVGSAKGDHPLLIPTTRDARPFHTAKDLFWSAERYSPDTWGQVVVMQFHGTPDTAHQWVNCPRDEFEEFLEMLARDKFTVIAMRDLAKYIDPDGGPNDPMAPIEARRERLRSGTKILHAVDGAEMVYVPKTLFIRGVNSDESVELAKELGFKSADDIGGWMSQPSYTFEPSGFFIDQYETTVARWKKFVAATSHQTKETETTRHFDDPAAQDFPAGAIHWDEAKAYAKWAGKQLPTETQWELAARGDLPRHFPWGNDPPDPKKGHFGTREQPPKSYARVGSASFRGTSPYNAYDMLGNQCEWTADWLKPYGEPVDPRWRDLQRQILVSVRGGSWRLGYSSFYVSKRIGQKPDETHPDVGFRTIWVPPAGYFDSNQYRKDLAAVDQRANPLTEAERTPAREERLSELSPNKHPLMADALIFQKGIDWAVRYDADVMTQADRDLVAKAKTRLAQRTDSLLAGKTPWMEIKGKKVHGYVSKVDGSVQPYGVIVPAKYDAKAPMRLDVVLHGSTKPVGLSELRFMARFDDGDVGAGFVPDVPYIELHPLGRVENCYRWAGETDVFEAIDDVCRRYNIDRSRIVLRGMSMGASGTWHLGLKHPSFFAALGPYCGYVDTHRFSETPLPNFVKVGQLPEHQERALHLLDSVDYAANAAVVPVVAAMGEKDIFFDAHVIMGEAFKKEKLELVNLLSPGTGHVVDPKTQADQLGRIAEHLTRRGRPDVAAPQNPGASDGIRIQPRGPKPPETLRFVTWSLKYNRCHGLELLELGRHYDRAEIQATLANGVLQIDEPQNIVRFAVEQQAFEAPIRSVRMGNNDVPLRRFADSRSPGRLVLQRDGERWSHLEDAGLNRSMKRPGVQGPIDDAFTTPFLCVRPTGTPWNEKANQSAVAAFDQFVQEWHHYFRGDCPVKNDSDVTDEDVRTKNLILFGDPGSNRWIAKALPKLPLEWTKDSLSLGGQTYAAADHLPALISASPLAQAESRYVVLNSGHTFGEAELAKVNYLLFPRWADWAVVKCDESTQKPSPTRPTPVKAGYFDENWK